MYIQDSENCIILPNDPSADKHRREKRLCRLPANLGRMEKQYAAGGGGGGGERDSRSAGSRMNMKRLLLSSSWNRP